MDESWATTVRLARPGGRNSSVVGVVVARNVRKRLIMDGKPLKYLVLALLFFYCPRITAEEEGLGDDRYVVHVLTMGPGDDLFSRFGHIALLVDDHEQQSRKVYNFGTFDFDDPELKVKYTRGFLNYWLSVGTFASTIRRYRFFDRELVRRTLNLSGRQAREVAERLEVNARPENRTYMYRHYLDNCCTRIRDILDDATGKALSKGRRDKYTGNTFRDWTRKLLDGLPVVRTAILFSLGPAVDRPITRYEEQFLPLVVAEDLDATFIGAAGESLVARKKTIVERRGPQVGKDVPTVDIVIGVLLFGLLGLGLLVPLIFAGTKITDRFLGLGLFVWGLLGGLGGILLVLYWTITTHYDTHYNENLLLMLPTHLWLIGPGLKLMVVGRVASPTTKALFWYLIFSLALIALDVLLKLGPFIQGNWEFIGFAAACTLASLGAVWRRREAV